MDNNLAASGPARHEQASLFDLLEEARDEESPTVPTPADAWDHDATKRALDELFSLTAQYRTSKAYHDLIQFVSRFRFYSPFNAMLIHVQMPGARFVAPPHRWLRDYGRRIKPGARPLVILQPMGPVMFVFDVSETELDSSLEGPFRPLPPEVEKPFEVRKGKLHNQLPRAVENAKRDGVAVHTARLGSQQGGSIRPARAPGKTVIFGEQRLPVRYELELDEAASQESRYAALAHELAHLYCGHLGTPSDKWWPDRRGLERQAEELEAESVAYMVCARLGIDNPSEQYLAGYVGRQSEVAPISLACVMKSTGLIESMGREKLKPRKGKP